MTKHFSNTQTANVKGMQNELKNYYKRFVEKLIEIPLRWTKDDA
jgi:hypothetical protein